MPQEWKSATDKDSLAKIGKYAEENDVIPMVSYFTHYVISPFKVKSLVIWHLKLVSRNNNISVTPHLKNFNIRTISLS